MPATKCEARRRPTAFALSRSAWLTALAQCPMRRNERFWPMVRIWHSVWKPCRHEWRATACGSATPRADIGHDLPVICVRMWSLIGPVESETCRTSDRSPPVVAADPMTPFKTAATRPGGTRDHRRTGCRYSFRMPERPIAARYEGGKEGCL